MGRLDETSLALFMDDLVASGQGNSSPDAHMDRTASRALNV